MILRSKTDPLISRSNCGKRGNAGTLSSRGEAGISIDLCTGSVLNSKGGYDISPKESKGFTNKVGSDLAARYGDVVNRDPLMSKSVALLFGTKAPRKGSAISAVSGVIAVYVKDDAED